MFSLCPAVEKPRCFSLFSKMKCFMFSGGDKKDEQKTPKSVSLTSNFSDRDINRSGSEFNSRDVSGTSTESSMGRKSSYPNMSTRASNLREFSITDLKSATKNFSRSVMIGEGGFGCVYRGTVRNLEDPSTKIEVAVKQLGKRGLQVSLFSSLVLKICRLSMGLTRLPHFRGFCRGIRSGLRK